MMGGGVLLLIMGTWVMAHAMHAVPYDAMLLGPGACGATLLSVFMILLVVDGGHLLGPIAV
jgi:hypothetical protein